MSCGNGFGRSDIGRKDKRNQPINQTETEVNEDEKPIETPTPIEEPIKEIEKPIEPKPKTNEEIFFEKNSGVWLSACYVIAEKNTSWLSTFSINKNEIILSYLDYYSKDCTGPQSKIYFEQFKIESASIKNEWLNIKAKCSVGCPQYKYLSIKSDKILFVNETNEGFNQNVKSHQFQTAPI
jgi:hypothetical protein